MFDFRELEKNSCQAQVQVAWRSGEARKADIWIIYFRHLSVLNVCRLCMFGLAQKGVPGLMHVVVPTGKLHLLRMPEYTV